MEKTPSLFADQALESPVDLAMALALPASAGHFDELHGAASLKAPAQPAASQSQTQSQSQGQSQSQQAALHLAGSLVAPAPAAPDTPPLAAAAALAPPWGRFFNFLGGDGFEDLNHRTANLQRQIRDNGVTYTVYADADGPQRPWSLDLFPLIVDAKSWTHIEAGVLQRVRARLLQAPGSQLFRMAFSGDRVDQPLLSDAIRRFDIDFTILHGQIDEIKGQAFGSLAVLADGTKANVDSAIAYLREQGVIIEELNHVI